MLDGITIRRATSPHSTATCCRYRVGLLDNRRLVAQFPALARRTTSAGRDRIDHPLDMHDDLSNATAGALVAAADRRNCIPTVAPIIVYSPAPGSQFDHPNW